MKITLREKALGADMYRVAQDLARLRAYLLLHLDGDYSVRPNEFWEQVFEQLGAAQYDTDIGVYFPKKSQGCPKHLLAPSREKISTE